MKATTNEEHEIISRWIQRHELQHQSNHELTSKSLILHIISFDVIEKIMGFNCNNIMKKSCLLQLVYLVVI